MNHSLHSYFPDFRRFASTGELERSDLYARLRPQLEQVLDTFVAEDFSVNAPAASDRARVVAWNIERGIHVDRIVEVLQGHPDMRQSDVLCLTELDYGMARSGNRFVAREIAMRLGFNYVFAPCYLNLEKGSGLENETAGENRQALHGNALLSRHPILQPGLVSLPNGKDKLKGKEKRLGCQKAAIGTIDHPLGRFQAVSVHLDAHSSQRHRARQMAIILDAIERRDGKLPALIGGDWNTSTYDSSRAAWAIVGFFRRTAMGVQHVLTHHYPHPDRWFERHLFGQLERRGYRYRELNEPGVCTLHYDAADLKTNRNLSDWVPQWCFWFIDRALRPHGGRCSLKLDWFAGRGIEPVAARVVGDVPRFEQPLSDHDPILLDFTICPGVRTQDPGFRG